ncbi:hypothetical protein OG21DRAFT_1003341 [Imleria badia]|nr:hypothetical protein OG21DRAFT_1003341 [Imleria badia]
MRRTRHVEAKPRHGSTRVRLRSSLCWLSDGCPPALLVRSTNMRNFLELRQLKILKSDRALRNAMPSTTLLSIIGLSHLAFLLRPVFSRLLKINLCREITCGAPRVRQGPRLQYLSQSLAPERDRQSAPIVSIPEYAKPTHRGAIVPVTRLTPGQQTGTMKEFPQSGLWLAAHIGYVT